MKPFFRLTQRPVRHIAIAGTLLLAGLFSLTGSDRQENMANIDTEQLYRRDEAKITLLDPDGAGFRPEGLERYQGELAIDLDEKHLEQNIRQIESLLGQKLYFNSSSSQKSGLMIAKVPENQMEETLKLLEDHPAVQAVEPNYIVQLDALPEIFAQNQESKEGDLPNDPLYEKQWNMRMIGAVDSWLYAQGANTTVSVIDTGVAYKDDGDFHQVEDLETTKIAPGYDFVNKNSRAYDDHAHGTHVAGTIAQSTNNGKGVIGVAHKAKIMPIKVLSGRGSGTIADIADGIRFSADHGADVINMSLGGPFPDSLNRQAVQYAQSRGVVVVCAAGNESRERSGYPANYEESISVSSVGPDKKLSFYTNYGSTIDIAAPGGDIRNFGEEGGILQNTIAVRNPSQSGYFAFQGTSMASPHVAGVASLIMSQGVTHPRAVKKILYHTSEKVEVPQGEKTGYGSGIVSAKRAAYFSQNVLGNFRLLASLMCLLMIGLVWIRQGKVLRFIPATLTAILAGSGFYFLVEGLGISSTDLCVLGRSFVSWDQFFFDHSPASNPIWQSALFPYLLSIFVATSKPLRTLVAGLCAGYTGYFLVSGLLGLVQLAFIPACLASLWLLSQAVMTFTLGVVLAKDQP